MTPLAKAVTLLCVYLHAAVAFNVAPGTPHPLPSATTISFNTRLYSSFPINNDDNIGENNDEQMNRRDLFVNGFKSILIVGSSLSSQPSHAFDNKISNKYDDRPKRRGPQPKDLGIRTRKDMVGEEYIGLKPCGPAPNCFCSTDAKEDDPEHNIPFWKYPSDQLDRTSAFQMLESTIKGYKPGQGNIDGGGFQIVTSDVQKGYMYVQFESLKNGYIDDVEFAYIDGVGAENEIQVRSSSRVGYLDFGVNAKRLNYIAKALRDKGWDAPGVDPATHQDYFAQNSQ